jgi:hypothetical protein
MYKVAFAVFLLVARPNNYKIKFVIAQISGLLTTKLAQKYKSIIKQ